MGNIVVLITLSVMTVIILSYIAIKYNNCVQLLNYVKEAFSTMDVYLKKRWDLIPNLVEITKGYVEHEKNTLKEIVYLRNVNYESMSKEEKIDINNQLTQNLSKLIAIAENYPELKAAEVFMKLQNKLSIIEEDIANSRKYYNGCVREFNTYIQLFPTNIIAKIFNFSEQALFEIENKQRENVEVSL